jgi:RNA polymerase sigma factor (TIGR02999 family)
MHSQPQTIQLLDLWRSGEEDARSRLVARFYPELRQIAAAKLRGESDSSLSTGDLINDAVLRLMRIERIDVSSRLHLIALAARLMRNILVDHARSKNSAKRQHQKVELCTRVDGEQRVDLISLELALVRLGALNMELAELVEMRYFGGMTIPDVSAVTGHSEATVKRRWQVARAWLTDALSDPFLDG